MPYRITDIGIDKTEKTFMLCYEKVCSSSAINKEDGSECEKFKRALEYLWNLEQGWL